MIRAEVWRDSPGYWCADIITNPDRDRSEPIPERPGGVSDYICPTHAEALAWAIDQTKGQDQ